MKRKERPAVGELWTWIPHKDYLSVVAGEEYIAIITSVNRGGVIKFSYYEKATKYFSTAGSWDVEAFLNSWELL